MKLCTRHNIQVVPQGGNTGLCGGATPDASGEQIILSLSRLNRVRGINPANNTMTVEAGWVLQTLGIANGADDPVISRKGCFGVFGKRKEWNSPIYAGDRLELYGPLLIDPKLARRKKANRDKDGQLKAKAKQRQEERKARARNANT